MTSMRELRAVPAERRGESGRGTSRTARGNGAGKGAGNLRQRPGGDANGNKGLAKQQTGRRETKRLWQNRG